MKTGNETGPILPTWIMQGNEDQAGPGGGELPRSNAFGSGIHGHAGFYIYPEFSYIIFTFESWTALEMYAVRFVNGIN
jgi:hypothetical protein